jgi:hypothetical protein
MADRTNDKQRAHDLCSRWTRMQGDRMPWDSQWQEIADLMSPRVAGITNKTSTPSSSRESLLFDTTAGDALMTMAGGLMSWTMPGGEPWFGFDPPSSLSRSDKVKAWAQDCTEAARKLLANSNFYTEAHEDLLAHCSFGTSCLFFEVDEGVARFEAFATGSYCIEENRFGMVDTLFREFELSAVQAAEKFGEENLPTKIREALQKEETKRSKFKFLHAVYPRSESERPDGVGRLAAHGKAFASCYVELGEKTIVRQGGFDSFPFSVGRYLKWTALEGKTAYGYGPGFAALPDTRQANFMQMMMACRLEQEVNPAMIADASMEGDIVRSAGGITWVESSLGQDRWPKLMEAGKPSSFQFGQDGIKMRQDSIRAKFHADLFDMFAKLEGIRTATEINERAAEKIVAITPAFTRLSSEKHTPMLKALFGMWMEAGLLPMPPPEAIQQVSQFIGIVPTPDIQFSSRLALAIKGLRSVNTQRFIAEILPVAQIRPEVLAPFDWLALSRGMARDAGMPTEYIKDVDQVAAEMQAQAKAAAAQQQMMMAEQGAKAAGHLGGIPAIQGAMQQ